MESTYPASGWEPVGESFYRRIQLYTALFDADMDLNNYKVVGALYGGAIALYRHEDKIVAHRPGTSSKPSIDIYSSAGKLLRSILWDKGPVSGLGWSEDEKLLVITKDGTVRCYFDLQGDFSQFSLGHGAEEYGVVSCCFYDTGLVALLSNNVFVTISSYDEPRPKALAPCPEGRIRSWTLIPPMYTLSRSVEVLAGIGQTLYVTDATDCESGFLDMGPITHISVSPNGKYVAVYTEAGVTHVVTSDFQTRLSEYASRSRISPRSLHWCGNDAVIIAWEDEAHVIGPGGSAARFFYDGTIHVPDVTDQAFRSGAESSASILLDAAIHLEKHSPKADDNIQLIRSNLTEAVDTCVNAAGHEFSVHWQKQLLRAASFGKSVLDIYNSDDFVDMCETLRVLNAVRYFDIGLPLSYEQYQRLGADGLIKRLLNRHEHLLALRVASYLRLPTDKIHVHWASAKARDGSEDDDAICRLVVDRLAGKPGVSFEAVARTAYDEGRAHLATELLNHEPRAARQVPLLLRMDKDDVALDKAIESGDTDLTAFVLHHLRRKLPLASFFRVLSNRPVAAALVEAVAWRYEDSILLKDLFYQDDRRLEGASIFLHEAILQPEARTACDKLAIAAKLLVDSSKEHAFELGALREATMLLRSQVAFDRDLTDSFTGLSVNETMFKLVRLGYYGRAKKIQAEFKVPERVAWWIRLRALVAKRDWNELEEMGKARKSPIGWEPFFNSILQAGNARLASTFVARCTNLEPAAAIAMYEKCGMASNAAEVAVKVKDREAWTRLLNSAGRHTSEGREIERLAQGVFSKD